MGSAAESSVAYLLVQLSLPVVESLMSMKANQFVGDQGVLTEGDKRVCDKVISECTVLQLSAKDASYADCFGWLESLEGVAGCSWRFRLC